MYFNLSVITSRKINLTKPLPQVKIRIKEPVKGELHVFTDNKRNMVKTNANPSGRISHTCMM